MADASEITVSVERAFHDRLKDAIQEISKQHGIRVHDLRVDWLVTRPIGARPEFTVTGLTVTTESGD